MINKKYISIYLVILAFGLSQLLAMKAESKPLKGTTEKTTKHRTGSLKKCDMASFSTPFPSQIENYYKAHCINIDNNERICKAIDDDGNGFIILFDSHNQSTKISAPSYLGDTEDFEVLKKDFDLDGNKELIVVNHDSTTMGMAVAYWTSLIFDGKDGYKQIPLMFEVQDYGQRIFVRDGSSDRCLILTTAWSSGTNKKGLEGSYFVGRLYSYHQGKLIIDKKYPIIARRYLNSFNEDRAAADSLQWIKNNKTEYRTKELKFDVYDKPVSKEHGVVESIELKNDNLEQRYYLIKIRYANGHIESYSYLRAGQEVPTSKHISYFGEARSKRFYPPNYEPSNLKEELLNRKVLIGRYKDRYDYIITVLWFE